MIDGILAFWILLFVIILIVHLIADSATWGMLGGFWLMILGLAILITGIQIQSGVSITDTTVTNTYTDWILPFSTYAYVWGLFLVSISMYMVLANGMKRFA